MTELKPCPFCGGSAEIVLCDDEGNRRPREYIENPYSGLGFEIAHYSLPNSSCPIAMYRCDGGVMGVYIYDSEEEAAEAWNKRVL